MANIYGIDSNGMTVVVGEMDDSNIKNISDAEHKPVVRSTKETVVGESFEAKKARLANKKKKKKDVKESSKPEGSTPEGDEDAIMDPDNETPVGVGNTAQDKKKKKGTASECSGRKKK